MSDILIQASSGKLSDRSTKNDPLSPWILPLQSSGTWNVHSEAFLSNKAGDKQLYQVSAPETFFKYRETRNVLKDDMGWGTAAKLSFSPRKACPSCHHRLYPWHWSDDFNRECHHDTTLVFLLLHSSSTLPSEAHQRLDPSWLTPGLLHEWV
jgi:hypothetical protein